jgi:hypothetical protein
MSYVDIVICIGSHPILETWPSIYRGQERTVRDRLKASQVLHPCLLLLYTLFDKFFFEFIRRPISPILSPSSRTFVELTLVREGWGREDGRLRLESIWSWKKNKTDTA